MASKKYKNKPCVYCTGTDLPTEREHVLAQEFVLQGTPVGQWPCAPSCRRCNAEKADLERYVTAVAPFGGRHRDALTNLQQNGERRLAKNLPIARSLRLRRSHDWVKHGGLWVQPGEVEFDWQRLEHLCAFIAKGLAWHHWGVLLGDNCFVDVYRPLIGRPRQVFQQLRRLRGTRLTGAVGGDTFTYSGAQGTDNTVITVWEMRLYGGLRSTTDPNGLIGIMTGPKHVRDRAAQRARWLNGTRLHV
jgi:hypothetical protein